MCGSTGLEASIETGVGIRANIVHEGIAVADTPIVDIHIIGPTSCLEIGVVTFQ